LRHYKYLRICLTCLFVFFILFIFTEPGFSGTTGKIVGRVTDAGTGEPLFGCNVIIEGTYLGAATNADGEYLILNVPPGVYRVKVGMIGYNTTIMENILVSVDLTTHQDFQLGSTIIKGKEVVVVAERPLIRKDITSSSSRVTAKELEAIPVETFNEVIQTKAGIVDGHFRGGRSGETLYMIDGMPSTDPFNGDFATNIENESIQEMEIITGSFNAEYGTAMSGVVNIVTKDGSNNMHGGINLYTGQWFTTHDDIHPGNNKLDLFSINNIQGSLSGAILKDKLFFFTTFRYYEEDGHYYGRNIFNPTDAFYKSPNEQQIVVTSDPYLANSLYSAMMANPDADSISIIYATGDSAFIPMNPYKKLNIQAKLTYRLSDKITLKYNIVTENPQNFTDNLDPMTYSDYDHAFEYNPKGLLTKESYSYNQTLQMVHQISSTTFYTLGVNRFSNNFKEYYFDDPNDPMYGYLASILYGLPPNTYNIGGVQNHHYKRNTNSWVVKGDLTSQINKRHQIKTGIEFQSHHLNNRDFSFDLTTGRSQGDVLDVNPVQGACYIQDKIEFSDIIVNAGLRLDYFDPNTKIPADPTDPNIKSPLRSWLQDYTLEELEKIWWKEVDPKIQLSPRLGLAYPITDRGVIHISYGHFFQIPNFEYLYSNPEWELGNDIGNIVTMGNPDLDAQQTISYEIGLQQQLAPKLTMNVDYYVRDIRGWINREYRVKARDGRLYDQYINSEYATIRGITLVLKKAFYDGYGFNLDYTFQIAEGTGSDPNAGITRLNTGQTIEKQVLPLDWDRRHTINGTVFIGNPGSWTASMLMTLGSGLPYDATAQNTPSPFLQNDGRKPFFMNFDFKYSKMIRMFSANHTFYIKINNVFDIMNETNVYGDSGRSTYSKAESTVIQGDFSATVNSLEEYYNDPSRFSAPMRITIGYQLDL